MLISITQNLGKCMKKPTYFISTTFLIYCLLIVYNILSHGIYWSSLIFSSVHWSFFNSYLPFINRLLSFPGIYWSSLILSRHSLIVVLSFSDIYWSIFILSWYSLIVFYPFLAFVGHLLSFPGIHQLSFILFWHSLIVFYPFLEFIDRLLSFPWIHWSSCDKYSGPIVNLDKLCFTLSI